MITDDTILEKLSWQKFDNNKSYPIAREKYRDILSYTFPELNILSSRVCSYGIEIKEWQDGYYFRGINLNFYNNFERKTRFRLIEFKGIALDFKTKVRQKFEVLKALKQEADDKCAIEGKKRIAASIEIRELTEIAKRAFDKYEVNITKYSDGYTLCLKICFNDKRELLRFCDLEELV